MKSGESRANANRAIRQEALREQLYAKGLVQKVLDDADKMGDLTQPLDPQELARIKAATDTRLALIKKVLPDLKAMELTGENGNPMRIDVRKASDDELQAIIAAEK